MAIETCELHRNEMHLQQMTCCAYFIKILQSRKEDEQQQQQNYRTHFQAHLSKQKKWRSENNDRQQIECSKVNDKQAEYKKKKKWKIIKTLQLKRMVRIPSSDFNSENRNG